MEKTVRVLMIPLRQPPCIAYLYPTIDALRCAVSIGAYAVGNVKSKRLSDGIYIICNADDLVSDFDGNRKVDDEIIMGTFYVVATNEYGEMISLTDSQIDVYSERFRVIEYYDYSETMRINWEAYYNRLIKDE